jgi:hypothetical protein
MADDESDPNTKKEPPMTTTTLASRDSTRLDDITTRALKSRPRQWLFIAAVVVVTLVTAGTIAFGATVF